MLMVILKTTFAFILSYIVLSFQINNKYFFDHIVDFTGPLGENIQRALKDAGSKGFHKSKDVATQLFTNAEPKVKNNLIQGAKTSLKSVQKSSHQSKDNFLEDLKQEEMRYLDEVIEKN